MKGIFASARYANVTATLALVVALGGTGAYAAGAIRSSDIVDGQVKAADVARGAVTSTKVRDGSLQARDFRHGELRRGATGPGGPAGPAGTAGPTGPAGATGSPGPAGELADTLPSGRTLRGAYAFSGDNTPADSAPADGHISFQIPLPITPVAEVVEKGSAATANCPGSVTNPTARPGVLCVYESAISDNTGLTAFSPETGAHGIATRFGVGLFITAASGPSSVNRTSKGTWAVTAP